MAKNKWIELSGGRIKRWKKSEPETGCKFGDKVPPRWYRKYLNAKERQKLKKALKKGQAHRFSYVHQHTANWYW